MAQNDFLQFDENNENVLTQDAYREDEQRISGAKSGVARSSLFNKVMRQASTFVAGFGQFISEKNINVLEDLNSVKTALTNLFTAKNIGVSTEVQSLLGVDNVDDALKNKNGFFLTKKSFANMKRDENGSIIMLTHTQGKSVTFKIPMSIAHYISLTSSTNAGVDSASATIKDENDEIVLQVSKSGVGSQTSFLLNERVNDETGEYTVIFTVSGNYGTGDNTLKINDYY